jgi:hypothetical protein
MGRLVGIGREQLPSGSAVDEGDVDRGSRRLEPASRRCRLTERSADQFAVLVEDQDIWCERVLISNTPPGHAVSSLQTLGRPWPDSRTNTWKLLELPRKAIPVGALRPAAKTDAVNPGGRLMDGAKLGLKNAVLFIQSGAVDGFDTVCATATVVSASSGATPHAAVRIYVPLRRMGSSPILALARGYLLKLPASPVREMASAPPGLSSKRGYRCSTRATANYSTPF